MFLFFLVFVFSLDLTNKDKGINVVIHCECFLVMDIKGLLFVLRFNMYLKTNTKSVANLIKIFFFKGYVKCVFTVKQV